MIPFTFYVLGTSCCGKKRETRIDERICSYFKVTGFQPWKFVREGDDGESTQLLLFGMCLKTFSKVGEDTIQKQTVG